MRTRSPPGRVNSFKSAYNDQSKQADQGDENRHFEQTCPGGHADSGGYPEAGSGCQPSDIETRLDYRPGTEETDAGNDLSRSYADQHVGAKTSGASVDVSFKTDSPA